MLINKTTKNSTINKTFSEFTDKINETSMKNFASFNEIMNKKNSILFVNAKISISFFQQQFSVQKNAVFIHDESKLNVVYVTFDINFQLINDLFYHIKNETVRFCIFSNYIQKIFRLVHDANAHVEYYRTYSKLVDVVYIRKFSKRLTTYIRHCFKC